MTSVRYRRRADYPLARTTHNGLASGALGNLIGDEHCDHPDARRVLDDIAQRYGVSSDAAMSMLRAVHAGNGTMAQFSIPELGGSGQWMRGGMTMVGNMFDNGLKARVDGLCHELAQLLTAATVFVEPSPKNWWPVGLGVPSAIGGQNDMRYAVFPSSRRLALQLGGATRVFDTGEHRIGGVQQQQGGQAARSASFTSQLGTFDVSSLEEIATPRRAPDPAVAAEPLASASSAPPSPSASSEAAEIIAAIESLAGLHQRGILSDEEFGAKKAELLGRI